MQLDWALKPLSTTFRIFFYQSFCSPGTFPGKFIMKNKKIHSKSLRKKYVAVRTKVKQLAKSFSKLRSSTDYYHKCSLKISGRVWRAECKF